jgi:hypothetical protein
MKFRFAVTHLETKTAQLIGYCFSTESQHSFGTVRPWSLHFCRFQVAEVTSNTLGDLCRSQRKEVQLALDSLRCAICKTPPGCAGEAL